MTELPLPEEAIFLQALEIEAPAQRVAFLDRACAADARLRAAVDALLLASMKSGDLLDISERPDTSPTLGQPSAERAGTQIGPYKILQQIGEGGMGVVYMAEQTEPVQRRVALKIIKPGMDSRQVIARFAAEKQALALMDHVNIARVLDAGTVGEGVRNQGSGVREEGSNLTPDSCLLTPGSGRPYFVMELVHGVPITKYCDDNHLTPRQRLELFVPVCQAIQHAHQKGIIHRDIKPSNVMVTLYDGKPVPKVIDFGVAKATEQKLTERTLFTQYGTMVGTLEYMSPEQAEMSALGVDTRSDIYSLGVLLYELLTGSTPLSSKQMKEAAHGEILRLIREEEPPKPSTRLSDSGEALASISANRHTEPAKLSKLMRGELDWIVMKTLEKDRNRRYETANAFAADVQRYLADEPVLACQPSAGYRLRKFVRRNKWPSLAGMLVVLALVVGSMGMSIGLLHARAAERKANKERENAEAEADNFKAVSEFLRDHVLTTTDGDMYLLREIDRETTLREILDRASRRIAGRFHQRPLAEAAVRDTIASSYNHLNDYASAKPHLAWAYETRRRLLGPGHSHTLKSQYDYALSATETQDLETARSLLTALLDAESIRAVPESDFTLRIKQTLAGVHRSLGDWESAKSECLQCVAAARHWHNPPTLAKTLFFLGELLVRKHEFAEAEPVLREAVSLWQKFDTDPKRIDEARSKHQLALALDGQKNHAEAERLLLEVCEYANTRRAQGDGWTARVWLPMFIEDLIRHYEATGNGEKAAIWRKELEKTKR